MLLVLQLQSDQRIVLQVVVSPSSEQVTTKIDCSNRLTEHSRTSIQYQKKEDLQSLLL